MLMLIVHIEIDTTEDNYLNAQINPRHTDEERKKE